MIESARAVLGDRAEFVVADAQELPFADRSFEVVLANHMLYHVPDRPRALREIARVLAPGGVLHAATNGHRHLLELRELVGHDDWPFAEHIDEFGLETGRAQLEAVFADVTCERYEDGLQVTEVEPVLAFVRSGVGWRGDPEVLRAKLEAAFGADGVLRISKESGVFHAHRP